MEIFLKAFKNAPPKIQFVMYMQVLVTRVLQKQFDPGLLNGIVVKVP